MAKDPAMLWYWNDWYSSTSLLSRFIKGCYMDILHAQFNHGRLSLEEIKTCLGSDFGLAWPALQKKFKSDSSGLFFNERLEMEKEKRQAFNESRRQSILKRSYVRNTYEDNTNVRMDNENEDVNESRRKTVFKKPSLLEVKAFFKEKGYSQIVAERAFGGYDAANWHDTKGKPVLNWKQKMINVWFKEENKEAAKNNNSFV